MEEKYSNTSSELVELKTDVSATSLLINKRPTIDELRKGFKATPNSVLSRVRNFLPQMAAANNDLRMKMEQEPDFSPDIEHIDDETSPHIQMTLALVEQDDSDSSEESDIDSEDDINYGAVTEQNIKLPNQHKPSQAPLIAELDSENNNTSVHSETNKVTVDLEPSTKTDQNMDT